MSRWASTTRSRSPSLRKPRFRSALHGSSLKGRRYPTEHGYDSDESYGSSEDDGGSAPRYPSHVSSDDEGYGGSDSHTQSTSLTLASIDHSNTGTSNASASKSILLKRKKHSAEGSKAYHDLWMTATDDDAQPFENRSPREKDRVIHFQQDANMPTADAWDRQHRPEGKQSGGSRQRNLNPWDGMDLGQLMTIVQQSGITTVPTAAQTLDTLYPLTHAVRYKGLDPSTFDASQLSAYETEQKSFKDKKYIMWDDLSKEHPVTDLSGAPVEGVTESFALLQDVGRISRLKEDKCAASGNMRELFGFIASGHTVMCSTDAERNKYLDHGYYWTGETGKNGIRHPEQLNLMTLLGKNGATARDFTRDYEADGPDAEYTRNPLKPEETAMSGDDDRYKVARTLFLRHLVSKGHLDPKDPHASVASLAYTAEQWDSMYPGFKNSNWESGVPSDYSAFASKLTETMPQKMIELSMRGLKPRQVAKTFQALYDRTPISTEEASVLYPTLSEYSMSDIMTSDALSDYERDQVRRRFQYEERSFNKENYIVVGQVDDDGVDTKSFIPSDAEIVAGYKKGRDMIEAEMARITAGEEAKKAAAEAESEKSKQ